MEGDPGRPMSDIEDAGDPMAARAAEDDGAAPDDRAELVEQLYDELRGLAAAKVAGERGGHTLRPTDLVHEAWIRLARDRAAWRSRTVFLRVAAVTMRRVLVDHARTRRAAKRGDGWTRIALTDGIAVALPPEVDVIALDEALTALAARDARRARLVELRFFAGMSMPEVATALGVSLSTAEADWRFAQAWLHRAMTAERDGAAPP